MDALIPAAEIEQAIALFRMVSPLEVYGLLIELSKHNIDQLAKYLHKLQLVVYANDEFP